ncbi:hypothetical protein [Pedobacter mendelii]|uniref:hypothetical protein n=1 Tax=Pedobacter mendelii TaxID=1908240 RepID=UPI001666493D|nr:hypothetical protein [Pedobacter mendelii]
MINKKYIIVFLFNLFLSVLYFKQLFYLGIEVKFLDVKGILVTPFAIFYNLLSIIFLLVIFDNKKHNSSNKSAPEKAGFLLFLTVLVGFLIIPITFLTIEGGRKIASPLLLAFLEPIKGKFLFKQSIKLVFIKNLILFVFSFVLFFLADLLPQSSVLSKNNWPLYFGGLYFLGLALLDYFFCNRQLKEITKNRRKNYTD